MSFSRLVARWQGLALSLVGVVATVWLGLSGQLGLYIHPRYFVFTLIMAAVAVVLIVGAFAAVPAADDDDHAGHGHGPGAHGSGSHDAGGHRAPGGRSRLWMLTATAASILVVVAAVVALLVVPPATLTSSTVEQRSINSASTTLDANRTSGGVGSAAPGGSDDTSAYTVKDWSLLLRQGVGLDWFDGRSASVTGFVTPDADDPDNVFFVARFVVTCCAVDAQPVGVAVYEPGWQSSYPTDSWVSVDGTFGADPSVLSTANIVLTPASITGIPQPSDPYVY
ncbi:TIGR03943 family protein [Subtercola sp. Z020]|uniref:TIGR03943 family putative permease subunit n=1 Tax=Subtercola sp. Z020 TaxID=2080582 RepID=UPI000CE790DF|nr:TIGR03943 family protein [Subtercola sp. Z020]PPF80289.1 TIGR03943 family protein [Subtercola sp. Z020]